MSCTRILKVLSVAFLPAKIPMVETTSMCRVVLLLIVAMALPSKAAQPAKAFHVKHPVFDASVTSADRQSLEQTLRSLLEASDAQLAAMVPKRNGILFCGCPNCDAGSHDLQMRWLGWEDPDKVMCQYCEMVFPNARYPEDQTVTARNPQGKRISFKYFRDDQGMYFFSARARYARKAWLASQTLKLAQLAVLSKDPDHERKAIVLLDAFGEKYPGWCVMSDRHYQERGPLDSYPEKPLPYYGGIWTRWFYHDIPQELLLAYDLLIDSPQWQNLSKQKGLDIRRRVEDELFRRAVTFVRRYDEKQTNKSPYLYVGLVIAGRVLGEPDYVHDAVDRFRQLLMSQFFFDGIWREGSASYHRATLNGLNEVIKVAKGYSDPEGYHWPQDGSRFDQLDLMAQIPFLEKIVRAKSTLVFPNGRVVPVHDAWASEESQLLDPPQTRLLAAMEHCCLHRGTASNQMQARLHFAPGYGHKHRDQLSLILWAGGRELLCDIGYTHTAYRKAWASSTPAHNTVVVNETEQLFKGDRSDVSLFDSAPGLLQTVEATATAAYSRLTTEYRRQLILVDVTPEQAYVVDVFRVAGGNRHDWFLHGSADYDQTVVTNLDMKPVAGTLLGPAVPFRLPTHERDLGDAGDRNISYAFVRDLKQNATDSLWSATFQFDRESPIQLRTTMLGQPGTIIMRGRCPSIRRAGEDDSKLTDFTMPVIVARRQGEDLISSFVAVHEPFRRRPFIQNIRRLTLSGDTEGPTALEIVHDGLRDIVICCTEEHANELLTISANPTITFSGRTGFVRLRGTDVVAAYLLDGELLRCADVELTSLAWEGVVTDVVRDGRKYGFRVSDKLPNDGQLVGRTMLVTLSDGVCHGYRIENIEDATGGSMIVLADDPGFAVRGGKETKFLYYPQRELSGIHRYQILASSSWRRTD